MDKRNKLIGLITDRDIREAALSDATTLSIREMHYLLGRLQVSSIMTPKDKLITISPNTLVEEAVQYEYSGPLLPMSPDVRSNQSGGCANASIVL